MENNEKVTKVVWTKQAQIALNQILDYRYAEIPNARRIVRTDIINKSKSITYPEQYPKDNILSQYRRIIVRDYKIIYKSEKQVVYVMNVVCLLSEY